jgi:hypothetical protein
MKHSYREFQMKCPCTIPALSVLFVLVALSTFAFPQGGDTIKITENPPELRDASLSRRGSVDITIGASLPTGSGSDVVNTGFTIGVSPYGILIDHLWLGFIIQYNTWGVNEDGVLKEFENIFGPKPSSVPFNASGRASYFSVSPTLRFQSNVRNHANLFAGLSFGFYHGSSSLAMTINSISQKASTSTSDFGMSFYGGILLPKSPTFNISLGASYNTVFSEHENTKYFDLKFGFCFLY